MPTAHMPWWLSHPRRTLVPRRVQEFAYSSVVANRLAPVSSWLATQATRIRYTGAQKQCPFSLLVHVQLIHWLAAAALILAQAKQRFTSKGWFSLSM